MQTHTHSFDLRGQRESVSKSEMVNERKSEVRAKLRQWSRTGQEQQRQSKQRWRQVTAGNVGERGDKWATMSTFVRLPLYLVRAEFEET